MKHGVWSVLLALLLVGGVGAAPRNLLWPEMIPAGTEPQAEVPISHAGGEAGPAAVQVDSGAPVVEALAGQSVRLPGYVVPLQTDAEGRVTEFLLVPYYGACIHVPPPPANQIVHVRAPEGLEQEALYQPYWVEGVLQVQRYESELATAGYSLQAERIEIYALD